ncbi:MAG: hypothetical protein WCG02_03990 [Candidatus Taylorbacteria bacterium]
MKTDFSLDDVKHETVQKYEPKFLAKGGEQIVYDTRSGFPRGSAAMTI